MTAALWLSAVCCAGAAEVPAPGHVNEFGWHRWGREDANCDRLYRLSSGGEWYDAWYSAWWATDRDHDPVPHLYQLRRAIGPVAYRWRRMPPPTPGMWR